MLLVPHPYPLGIHSKCRGLLFANTHDSPLADIFMVAVAWLAQIQYKPSARLLMSLEAVLRNTR